jgi:hypothetical protein
MVVRVEAEPWVIAHPFLSGSSEAPLRSNLSAGASPAFLEAAARACSTVRNPAKSRLTFR